MVENSVGRNRLSRVVEMKGRTCVADRYLRIGAENVVSFQFLRAGLSEQRLGLHSIEVVSSEDHIKYGVDILADLLIPESRELRGTGAHDIV